MSKKPDAPKSILDLLPEDQRAEIVAKTITAAARNLVSESATIGDFIAAVNAHDFAAELGEVPIVDVVTVLTDEEPEEEPKKPRKPRASKAETEKLLVDVLTYVEKNPGKKVSEIAAGLGYDQADVGKALARLKKGEKVKGEGPKRATVYTAVAPAVSAAK